VSRGLAKNYAEADRWYRKAAEQGVASVQYELGFMYAAGWGVSENYVTAYKWVILALSQTHPNSPEYSSIVESRNDLAHLMSKEQIAEAQNQAKEE
jgi:TPR repeat protein